MQARILMAGALFSGAMMVPAPHAASVTTRYKVAQRIFQEVDATALGGGKQGFVVKTTSYVQLTLTDTTGGRSVKVTVDSIHGDSLPPGAPADMLSKAAGVVVTGVVDAKGKLSNVKASSDAGGLQLTSLRAAAPPAHQEQPQGRRCLDGHHGDGERQHEHAHRHQFQGHRHRDARRTSRRARSMGRSAPSIAGTQETPGGSADIDGTGTGTSSYLIAPDGALLGGTSSSKSNLNVTLAAQGAILPLVLSQSVEITPLP